MPSSVERIKERQLLQKCKHGRRQNGWFCRPCGGGGSCEHQHNKYRCSTCRPTRLGSYSDPTCEHGYVSGRNCPRCKRSGYCNHGNRKVDCPQCANCVCEIEGCHMRGHRYAGPNSLLKHMRAFHGDNPKALTKTKELEVHQLLGKSGIQFEYQHHLPFRNCGLESETTRAFADFVLYASWGAIILEVDENQHSHQDPSCDVRRDFDMVASVALGSQHKLAIVRYSPDAFKEEPEKAFQRLFLFYDRAAEDSELPAVAEDWDVVARAPPVMELQGISAGQLATVLTA
ncbi:unnamed protein product, partial [Symbiodinium sp. KB8]